MSMECSPVLTFIYSEIRTPADIIWCLCSWIRPWPNRWCKGSEAVGDKPCALAPAPVRMHAKLNHPGIRTGQSTH